MKQIETTARRTGNPIEYHCVEFLLDTINLPYLFKLWHSVGNSMFLLIKENSAVLPNLEVGSVMPMKYHCANAVQRTEVCRTQIKQIVNERQGRFRGHCRVEIEMLPRVPDAAYH